MEEKKKDKKKDKKILILLLLLFLIIIICLVGYILYHPTQDTDRFADDKNAELGIMPGMSDEEIQNRLNTIIDEGMMNITINPKPVFETGSSMGKLCIENIEQNHFNYIVTIKLDDTQEVIYTSGLIRPNHFVEEAKLDVPLKKGTYNATAYFDAYKDDLTIAGSSIVRMTIEILN